jgi:hypothetical protein
MTDCAKYLNGYSIGAIYDGTYADSAYVGPCANKNNVAQWNQTFRDNMRGYIELSSRLLRPQRMAGSSRILRLRVHISGMLLNCWTLEFSLNH